MNSSASAPVSGGKATRISSDVISMFQVNSGSRHMVIPGARSMNTVAMRLIPVRIDDVLTARIPMIHMSVPGPGLYWPLDSGA
jgi:hypothetical protein